MNTEAQRARNARKRAKSRMRARCGTEDLSRFKIQVELFSQCVNYTEEECTAEPRIYKLGATPSHWVTPYDGAPIYKSKWVESEPSMVLITPTGALETVHRTFVSNWILFGTHDIPSHAREYLEVFYAMVNVYAQDPFEGFNPRGLRAQTTVFFQRGGDERSTTWRGEVGTVVADVIAAMESLLGQ